MIKVYSTDCPLCLKLKEKLIKENIGFEYISLTGDEAYVLGFKSMPVMKLEDDTTLDFNKSIQYINGLGRSKNENKF